MLVHVNRPDPPRLVQKSQLWGIIMRQSGTRPSNQRYFVKTCPMPISPIDDLRYFFLPSSDLFPVVFLSHSECFTLVATYYMNERVSCFHLRQMFSSTSSNTSSPAVCICCGHPSDLLLVRLVSEGCLIVSEGCLRHGRPRGRGRPRVPRVRQQWTIGRKCPPP